MIERIKTENDVRKQSEELNRRSEQQITHIWKRCETKQCGDIKFEIKKGQSKKK